MRAAPAAAALPDSRSVKMSAKWRLFLPSAAGGPLRRAKFILSNMRQGIDRIRMIENSAPMLSVLDSQAAGIDQDKRVYFRIVQLSVCTCAIWDDSRYGLVASI